MNRISTAIGALMLISLAVIATTIIQSRDVGNEPSQLPSQGGTLKRLIEFKNEIDGEVAVNFPGGQLHVPAPYLRQRRPDHAFFEVAYVAPDGGPLKDPAPPEEDVVRVVFQYHLVRDGIAEPQNMTVYSESHEIFWSHLRSGLVKKSDAPTIAGLDEYSDGSVTYRVPAIGGDSLTHNGNKPIFFCFIGFNRAPMKGVRRCKINLQYQAGWSVQADFAEKQLSDWRGLLNRIDIMANNYGAWK